MRLHFTAPAAPLLCALLLCALLHPAPLAAQGSGAGAIVLQFNPSARAAGMGESGTAVSWGQAPNHWANPALLAYHRGLRWERAEFELAVGLADDIVFEAERVTVGWRGIGLLAAGEPLSTPKGTRLSLGVMQGMDEEGNPTGTWEPWMKARSWGFGISLGELLGSFMPAHDAISLLTRHFDLAGGYVHTEYEDFFTPDELLPEGIGGSASASAYDYGFLVRVSPLNTVSRTVSSAPPLPGLDELCGGLKLDLTYGNAVLNAGDEWIVHVDGDQGDPLPKGHRWGWGAHLETGLPLPLREGLERSGLGWLGRSLTPLLAFGVTRDRVEPGYRWDPEAERYVYERDTTGWVEHDRGWEVSFANLFHVRRGHLKIEDWDIDGDTEGWGVGFEIGDAVGWRYDEATVPQAEDLPEVERSSWTVYVDVFAVNELLRHGR